MEYINNWIDIFIILKENIFDDLEYIMIIVIDRYIEVSEYFNKFY